MGSFKIFGEFQGVLPFKLCAFQMWYTSRKLCKRMKLSPV